MSENKFIHVNKVIKFSKFVREEREEPNKMPRIFDITKPQYFLHNRDLYLIFIKAKVEN